MELEDNELAIEKIDISTDIRTTRDMITAIVELQEKLNEVIDLVNVITLPDDDEALEDDEDEDEVVLTNTKSLTSSRK